MRPDAPRRPLRRAWSRIRRDHARAQPRRGHFSGHFGHITGLVYFSVSFHHGKRFVKGLIDGWRRGMGSRWQGLVAASAVTAAIMAAPATFGLLPDRVSEPAASRADQWVHSWVSMPQLTEPNNLPPAPFTQDDLVLADSTLRQTIHLSVGGPQIRL